MLLLNLNDWSAVANLDRRLTQLELPIAFAVTFMDMEKMKGNKKICRDAWDLVLATFSNNQKRSNSGNNSTIQAITLHNNGGGNTNNGSTCTALGLGSGNANGDGNNTLHDNSSNQMTNNGNNSTVNTANSGGGGGGSNNATSSGGGGGGGGNNGQRSSPCPGMANSLQNFIKMIRHQTVFNLMISILAKIHNLLKDDANYDINGEYMHLWPTSLSR